MKQPVLRSSYDQYSLR